jgi:hypothetical protein
MPSSPDASPRGAATLTRTTAIILASVALVACGAHGPAGEIRYRNADPVWLVNDRKPVAKQPKERESLLQLYHLDTYFVRPMTRAMDLPLHQRALDVNALDEVPDSTWFTNKIGIRDLTLDEIRAGANVDPSPIDARPWTIKSGKVGGVSLGFVIEDTRGDKYLLKFEPAVLPEMEHGAHIIMHRIVSAMGFNVPQDHLETIRREDIVLAPDATKKDPRGGKTPLTKDDLEAGLATVAVEKDGSYRVLVSKFVEGKPLGGYPIEGTRSDDPNDVIPHELRRSIRGQFPIFAWLNHTDVKWHNTLDAYVEDPAQPGVKYVKHYLIDFGKALGVHGYHKQRQTVGHTYSLDVGYAFPALLGLGVWTRPWESVSQPTLRGIGLYEVASFNPGAWRPNTHYWPLMDTDRFDAFWGTKLMMRFTRDQLAAIVEEARFSDPRAAEYMLETLVARQRKTARYWFERVTPLDSFTVAPDGNGLQLCFDDLMLKYELAIVSRETSYQFESFDYDGKPTTKSRAFASGPGGRSCVEGVVPGAAKDGYTIVKLTARRSARARPLPPVMVHLARDAAGAHRIIGLRRE